MGLYDEIYAGRSTFFVEMMETSSILANASSRSLVIIDELGRGTGTHDGSAIAFAVLEHLVTEVNLLSFNSVLILSFSNFLFFYGLVKVHHFVRHSLSCCCTAGRNNWKSDSQLSYGIFARLGRVRFVNSNDLNLWAFFLLHKTQLFPTDGKTEEDSLIFLYQLRRGKCPKSFGLNVARLAGIPTAVIKRAKIKSEQFLSEQELFKYSLTGLLFLFSVDSLYLLAITGLMYQNCNDSARRINPVTWHFMINFNFLSILSFFRVFGTINLFSISSINT